LYGSEHCRRKPAGPPDLSRTTSPGLKVFAMSNNPLNRWYFKANRLKLIAASEQFQDDREPPLRLGDIVALNREAAMRVVHVRVDRVDFGKILRTAPKSC
jgi:hypothetical protein